ncbi:probable very-long-chain enoyl-CoA reductase art-1, partial [Eurytemora carolleeae]|uniref:probable very-long-chain enoyl-CoA reductase art-1 n=1 Tax=Eurytemora carolleeae TaxID=1294199 RepID=UPI000C76C978
KNLKAYYYSRCDVQVYLGLAGFSICEMGNFSIHLLLRNLRPEGSKVRKIPYPNWNPLTSLFNFVSCPNYTYEIGAWISFTVMTQCLPAGIFTVAGAYQMIMWALGKHRNYRAEFKTNYQL